MKQDGGEGDICPFLHLHLFKHTLHSSLSTFQSFWSITTSKYARPASPVHDNLASCQPACWVARTALTNHHTLGGLDNKSLFPHGLESKKPRSRCQQGVCLLKSLLPGS